MRWRLSNPASPKGFRFLLPAALVALAAAVGLAQEPGESPAGEARPRITRIQLDSIIHRGSAEFVVEALEAAEAQGHDAFVLELSTPGGVLDSTRQIFTAILNSTLPVIVYVSPRGSQAASAGFFILMSADVAAMAPGTNTGAAHPVAGDGGDIEGHMGEKVEQDSTATIRSLAARHGRNVELAEAAVLESRSYTAEEALEAGLIELVAEDLDDLLAQLDGREVAGKGDTPVALRTADARVETVEMSAFQKFLSTIAHPNIAAILMTLGFLGIYFELQSPGGILPGVVGAICLILGFLALSVLPVNYAGVALIVLAVVFFIAEIKVTSYGLLTVGGVISLAIGYALLFRSADPVLRVSSSVIVAVALFAAVVVGFLMTLVVRAHKSQVTTGAEGLVNRHAVARTDLDPAGKVFVWGEIWNAQADRPVAAGSTVVITAVEGMTLKVRGLDAPPAANAPRREIA